MSGMKDDESEWRFLLIKNKFEANIYDPRACVDMFTSFLSSGIEESMEKNAANRVIAYGKFPAQKVSYTLNKTNQLNYNLFESRGTKTIGFPRIFTNRYCRVNVSGMIFKTRKIVCTFSNKETPFTDPNSDEVKGLENIRVSVLVTSNTVYTADEDLYGETALLFEHIVSKNMLLYVPKRIEDEPGKRDYEAFYSCEFVSQSGGKRRSKTAKK